MQWETRACETSERENCCVPHYDESHEGGKSSPDLCAQSCPTPDWHGYNEEAVAEASKTNKATCIIDSNTGMHTWTNVLQHKCTWWHHHYCTIMMTSSCADAQHNSLAFSLPPENLQSDKGGVCQATIMEASKLQERCRTILIINAANHCHPPLQRGNWFWKTSWAEFRMLLSSCHVFFFQIVLWVCVCVCVCLCCHGFNSLHRHICSLINVINIQSSQ